MNRSIYRNKENLITKDVILRSRADKILFFLLTLK